MRPRPRRAEEILQRALVAHLRERLPPPWLVWHTPNGAGRSKAEAGILKAMGVLAGVPDLLVVGPRTAIPLDGAVGAVSVASSATLARLIAIELKAPPKPLRRGGVSKAKPRVSDAQRDVIAALGACGVPTLVCTDLDEAVAALTALGVPLRGRTP